MVKTKVVLEIETDRIEDATELIDQLRHGMTGELAGFDFGVGSVRHLVEPDIPKDPA